MSDDNSTLTFLKFFKKVENKDFYHHEPKHVITSLVLRLINNFV